MSGSSETAVLKNLTHFTLSTLRSKGRDNDIEDILMSVIHGCPFLESLSLVIDLNERRISSQAARRRFLFLSATWPYLKSLQLVEIFEFLRGVVEIPTSMERFLGRHPSLEVLTFSPEEYLPSGISLMGLLSRLKCIETQYMPKKLKAQLQREESLRKAQNTLQASESLQIPAETSETATEGNNNISGCADVVPAEEDVPEFMFDFVVESDDEEEIGDDSGIDGDIASEGELELFIRTLQEAQNAAQDEERQKNTNRKHPRFYSGNSMRSQQRHAANRRQLEAEGKTTFITQFFQSSKMQTMQGTSLLPEEPDFEIIEMLENQQEVNEKTSQDLDVKEGMGKEVCESLGEALNDIQLPSH
ncbi:hypothetical protein M422DRAFT_262652 [Sphaerobolus stellatus SS14]|uniref:Uncharacterized protein n=1 Tax=Sphaerobolus stellatus (strain SS14) TaxID=990650 RepID=A0A0C9TXA6_SPHS4|nr:hypothetical protein M422DRAFT_262652 [Sphaerobolus stellatus SS14]